MSSARAETAFALVSAGIGVVTILRPHWLEVAGWEPDHHEGAVEWMIAAVFLLIALAFGIRAHARR